MLIKGWIYLIFQLLMDFIDARTIQEVSEKIRTDLCVPINISVVLTSWSPVCVTLHWSCGFKQANGEWSYVNLSSLEQINKEKDKIVQPDELSAFRIKYAHEDSRYRFTQEVPPYINRTNIDNLQPNTKYTLTISSISINNPDGITSREVEFVSPAVVVSQPNPNDRFYNSFASLRLDTDNTINIRPGEVIVVIAVLCVWIYIIFHFIKKWGKIRSLEPSNVNRSNIRTGKSIVGETDSLNGTISAPSKSRLQSFANVTTIPKLHMSESHNSLYSEHQSLIAAQNSCKHLLTVSSNPRLRQNSVFLTSPSRRSSFLPDDNGKLPRRYKSAEDLQSLVLEITNVQRQQRKLSQISIKEDSPSHYDNCNLINDIDPNNAIIIDPHSSAYFSQQQSGSATRGSISAASRGSNGTLKFTDIAVAMVASNNQLSRIASPSKSSSSGRELIGSSACTTCTATTSSSGSKQSQTKQSRHKKNSIGIQVVNSSDSNQSTQATIASSEHDLELQSSINCQYCRRRMSNCDECSHCNGLNMVNLANRNLVLMQSKSFINHHNACSSENSSFENPCTTTSNSPGNGSNSQFRSSQQCLFQISEANDDIKHIDED